ncbi:LemA family protein [soil metagenome]
MEILFALIIAASLLALIYVLVQYNGLVTLRNHIAESWSNIDTELKRRYDLIPNLVATVKGYAAHESSLLARVTELRAQCAANHGSPARQSADENQLVGALRQLFVTVENYPSLKADEGYRKLQDELVTTENRIQAARRFFNGNVRDYRNKQECFPSSVVASAFGFGPAEFFEVEPAVRIAPDVKF